MFGLESGDKKKKEKEFIFDLEAELKSTKKYDEIKKQVEERIQEIKAVLRKGEKKEEFDHYGALLHGYTSILKVMTRAKGKK